MRGRLPAAAVVSLLLAALGAGTLVAQSDTARVIAKRGAMVRIHTPDSTVTGRLAALLTSADTVVNICRYLGPPCGGPSGAGGPRSFRVGDIIAIDVSKGSHWKRGGTIGGVIGAGIGVGLGLFAAGICDSGDCPGELEGVTVGVLLVGTIFGAVGALIGSGYQRW